MRVRSFLAAKGEKRSLSKLIKADHLPIVEVKEILPPIDEVEGGLEDETLFCPFAIDETGYESVEGEWPSGDGPDSSGTIEAGEESGRAAEKQESTDKESSSEGLDQVFLMQQRAEEVLEEAREQAHRLRKEAEHVLETARRKAEEMESQAYNNGFEQGRKDGEELGKRQFEAMANRLKSMVESLTAQGEELFSRYEAQMVRLCMKVAQKVVAVEIDTRPELILEILRHAFHQVQEATEIKVILNPKDLELVKEYVLGNPDLARGHKMEFLPNEAMDRGGCILETEFGLVDASMEERWKAIEESLEEALSGEKKLSKEQEH